MTRTETMTATEICAVLNAHRWTALDDSHTFLAASPSESEDALVIAAITDKAAHDYWHAAFRSTANGAGVDLATTWLASLDLPVEGGVVEFEFLPATRSGTQSDT